MKIPFALSRLLFALVLGSAISAQGEQRLGRIATADKKGEELFIEKTDYTRTSDTDYSTKATIEDLSGKLVMRESSRVVNSVVVEQYMEQLQLNEAYELKRKDKTLVFTTYKVDGDKRSLVSTSEESAPENFVTGPGIGIFLKNHRKELEAGETVKAQFGVFEMEKSIGFSFRKISADKGSLRIQMKITNVLLRMLVDPIDINVDVESFRIVGFQGRTPLRTGPADKLVPLDAKISYSYSGLETK